MGWVFPNSGSSIQDFGCGFFLHLAILGMIHSVDAGGFLGGTLVCCRGNESCWVVGGVVLVVEVLGWRSWLRIGGGGWRRRGVAGGSDGGVTGAGDCSRV